MVFENGVVLYAISSAFKCWQREINLNGHYKGNIMVKQYCEKKDINRIR